MVHRDDTRRAARHHHSPGSCALRPRKPGNVVDLRHRPPASRRIHRAGAHAARILLARTARRHRPHREPRPAPSIIPLYAAGRGTRRGRSEYRFPFAFLAASLSNDGCGGSDSADRLRQPRQPDPGPCRRAQPPRNQYPRRAGRQPPSDRNPVAYRKPALVCRRGLAGAGLRALGQFPPGCSHRAGIGGPRHPRPQARLARLFLCRVRRHSDRSLDRSGPGLADVAPGTRARAAPARRESKSRKIGQDPDRRPDRVIAGPSVRRGSAAADL